MTAHPPRRRFLRHSLAHTATLGSLTGLALPGPAAHAAGSAATVAASSVLAPVPRGLGAGPLRQLALANAHTGEQLSLAYARGRSYIDQALVALNHLLRDPFTQETGHIDPALLDLLHSLRTTLGTKEPFKVISGYRSPATNERLRLTGGGGVAKESLHMHGRAIDISLPGVPLAELRDAAWSLQGGGVGYYPREQFVHLDTGAVRRW